MIFQRKNQASSAGTLSEGFEYQFTACVFNEYSGQDKLQVASAIEQTVCEVKERLPEAKEIGF